MTLWNPIWKVEIAGIDYTDAILSNLTITSGRANIYEQAQAGYINIELINLDQSPILAQINDSISVQLQDSTATFIPIFGGSIVDVAVSISDAGQVAYAQRITIIALGALARLPKALTNGVLNHDFDGDQIYTILSQVLFAQWNAVPAAETWAGYDPAVQWQDAENTGLGEIDQPGNYELAQRSSSRIDVYSLVSALATSGLGYIYESASGQIGYADSTHRTNYLAANGYVDLTANEALANSIKIQTRAGDVRNNITIKYGQNSNSEVSASDVDSIATFGTLSQIISTTIRHQPDAQDQADFYIALRKQPQPIFSSITYELTNPELSDGDRDSLINIFMGMPVFVSDLPLNMNAGSFAGFVEGWTFRAAYNQISVTPLFSPLAYSLNAMRWNDVPGTELWNTISPILDWENATIVA
jgi:hypothetical protein